MRIAVPILGLVTSEKPRIKTWAGTPGVPLTILLGELCPILFTELTLKSYSVLFDRPVTSAVVCTLIASEKTAHVPPVVSLYSMM